MWFLVKEEKHVAVQSQLFIQNFLAGPAESAPKLRVESAFDWRMGAQLNRASPPPPGSFSKDVCPKVYIILQDATNANSRRRRTWRRI